MATIGNDGIRLILHCSSLFTPPGLITDFWIHLMMTAVIMVL